MPRSLRDQTSTPDAFEQTCRRVDRSSALTGTSPPASLRRVEERFGSPSRTWRAREWRRAAFILGHLADELDALRYRQAPREHVSPILDALYALEPRSSGRKRGAPRRFEPDREKELLENFLSYKAALEAKGRKKLSDRDAIKVRVVEHLTSQGRRQSDAPRIVAAVAKDISRSRQRFGHPLRRKKPRIKKSQNPR
jgi:hypothetical protein